MKGWFLATVALLGCSPFEAMEHDRAADLAAIAARPPAERSAGLRDRVLRDDLNGRIRSIKAYDAIKDPAIDSMVARLPVTLAEDYLALGDALAAAGDRDGALAAYEDALVMTSRAGPDPARVTMRRAALRGEAAMWNGLGQAERARAATILADAEEFHPPPWDRAAFVLTAVRETEMPSFKRLATAPVFAEASSGPLDSFVATEVGHKAVATVAEALELLRSGAPASRLEPIAVHLAALAPPAPRGTASPAPSASEAPGTPPPPPSAALPTPPAPASSAPPPAIKEDVAARLKKLDELHKQKVITDAEYARERARILKEAL